MATKYLSDDDIAHVMRNPPPSVSLELSGFAGDVLARLDHIIGRRMRGNYYMHRPDRWARDSWRIMQAWHLSR